MSFTIFLILVLALLYYFNDKGNGGGDVAPTSTPEPKTNDKTISTFEEIRLTNENQSIQVGGNTINVRVDHVGDEYSDLSGQKLYVNDKLISSDSGQEEDFEIYANYVYVTDNFALFIGVYESPFILSYAIDSNGNEIKIAENDVYLSEFRLENGQIIARSFPIDYSEDSFASLVTVKYENNMITITPKE